MNRIDLDGRTAIVTGAASGLGRATANRLRASGARVSMWDLAAPGSTPPGESVPVDVSDPASVDAAARATESRFGPVDILVNCAGVLSPYGPTEAQSLDHWNRVLAVNLTGTFLVCRAVLAGMTARGYGRIVNISSSAAKDCYPYLAAYVASKAAVLAFSRSLGKEVADRGVLVNCVIPGIINTPMASAGDGRMDDGARARLFEEIPLRRIAEPEEVAALIAWLTSEECSYSAGAAFDASGGKTNW